MKRANRESGKKISLALNRKTMIDLCGGDVQSGSVIHTWEHPAGVVEAGAKKIYADVLDDQAGMASIINISIFL